VSGGPSANGGADPAESRQHNVAGMNDFVAKPVKLAELRLALLFHSRAGRKSG
jgi:hypothetical protein